MSADVLAAAPVTPGNVGAPPTRVEEVDAAVEERAAGRAGTDGAVGVEDASVGAAAGEGAAGGVVAIAALGAETAPLRSQGFGGDGMGVSGGEGRRGSVSRRWWWQRASLCCV